MIRINTVRFGNQANNTGGNPPAQPTPAPVTPITPQAGQTPPPQPAQSTLPPADVVVRYKQKLQHEITVGKHVFMADEPSAQGGDDAGPTPYDLLLSALGACTSMTILMYARMKKWPVEDVTVELRHEKIHAQDCADCETKNGKVDKITRDITVKGPLTDDQVARLKEIAGKCPVHKTLMGEIKVEDTIKHDANSNPPSP